MKKIFGAAAAAVLALAVVAPAFAGGAGCSGHDASAAMTDGHASCAGKSAAWSGAWLERSASGKVTVAEVAKGSPAARSGLKSGDVVLAVNGYDLGDAAERATCASKAECNVGSAVTYRVQRGHSTKTIKLKLEKMPVSATEHFASRQASFEPALAAVVVPAID
jgi:S1-C subfamily serine protease